MMMGSLPITVPPKEPKRPRPPVGASSFLASASVARHCQTNLNGPAKGAGLRRSDRELTPLGQGGRTVLFEDVAAVEVTVVVEVVVD